MTFGDRDQIASLTQRERETLQLLVDGLINKHWGRRYGRPVHLGKNPTRPKTRINTAGVAVDDHRHHRLRAGGSAGGPLIPARSI